jgi:hypothetical protein
MHILEWGLWCPEKRPQLHHSWIEENLNVANSSSSYVGECSSNALFSLFFADSERLCRTWLYHHLMLHCAERLTFTDIRSLGCFNCNLRLSVLPESFVRFSRRTFTSLGYVVTYIGIYSYRRFGRYSALSSVQFWWLRQCVSLKLWYKSPRIHGAVY